MTLSRTLTIALVSLSIGLSATSANAGILGDVVGKVGGKVLGLEGPVGAALKYRQQQQQAQQQKQAQGGGQYSWLANKPYLDCLKLMDAFAHGGGPFGSKKSGAALEQAQAKGRSQCNQRYYGHP